MTIILIVVAYIANVFVNRYLNYLLVVKHKHYSPMPLIWFIGPVATLVLGGFLIGEMNAEKTWFGGKNWD